MNSGNPLSSRPTLSPPPLDGREVYATATTSPAVHPPADAQPAIVIRSDPPTSALTWNLSGISRSGGDGGVDQIAPEPEGAGACDPRPLSRATCRRRHRRPGSPLFSGSHSWHPMLAVCGSTKSVRNRLSKGSDSIGGKVHKRLDVRAASGGEPTYRGRLGKDRSPRHSCRSIASEK